MHKPKKTSIFRKKIWILPQEIGYLENSSENPYENRHLNEIKTKKQLKRERGKIYINFFLEYKVISKEIVGEN